MNAPGSPCASRWSISSIPLYLLGGLAFGKGGLAPLDVSTGFIHIGAEIGVLLLLFMLGLEYTGEELKQNLRSGLPGGFADLALNFPPGLIAGLLLGGIILFTRVREHRRDDDEDDGAAI